MRIRVSPQFNERTVGYVPLAKRMVFLVIILSVVLGLLGEAIHEWGENPIRIVMLDVGQGDAMVIFDGNDCLLIDGGGIRDLPYDNVGLQVILPYLKQERVKKIHDIIITHAHYDHMKGVLELLGQIEVRRIILPAVYEEQASKDEDHLLEELYMKAEEEGVQVCYMRADDSIETKRMTLEALYPLYQQEISDEENHNSLVLLLQAENFSMLFTGDVEEEDEGKMVSLYEDLHVNILKVPHHGSHSSSSEEFLLSVNPDVGLVSYGNNSFGHPSDIVLLRYRNHKIPLYSTKNCGMIEVSVFDGYYEISGYQGALIDETAKRTY